MKLPIFPKKQFDEAFPEAGKHLSILAGAAQVPFESIYYNFQAYANHPAQITYRTALRESAGDLRPSSMYSLLIANSGERKSTMDGYFSKALDELSEYLRIKYIIDVKREKEREVTYRARNAFFEPMEIKQPSIVGSAPTAEGIRKAIGLGNHFYSIFSSEGGTFFGGYANNKENQLKTMAEFSKFKDGSYRAEVRATELTREKVREGDLLGAQSAISFSIYISQQKKVFAKLMSDDIAIQQGFLGRCFLLTAESYAGMRSANNSIPQDEINSAVQYFQKNFQSQYEEVKRLAVTPKYKVMYFKEDCLAEYKRLWNFFEPFTSEDNFIAEGATFCQRRLEHVLSIATTLQAFRLTETKEKALDKHPIDNDIFDLSWRLFHYFYGQFVYSLKPYFNKENQLDLPLETIKFLKYLKRALKKLHETEKDSLFDNLEFSIKTPIFDGISRIYRKRENIDKQVRILIKANLLKAIDEKTFKFINLHPLDACEVFPDPWNDTPYDGGDDGDFTTEDEDTEIVVNLDEIESESVLNLNNFNPVIKTNNPIPDYIFKEHLTKIKNSINLVDFIKSYVELKNGVGECPFHNDKTPSFMVKKDHYHCFGCEEHGDIFEFLIKYKGCSFKEALSHLEGCCGITSLYNNYNITPKFLENYEEDRFITSYNERKGITDKKEEQEQQDKIDYAAMLYARAGTDNNDQNIVNSAYLTKRLKGRLSELENLSQIGFIDSLYHKESQSAYPTQLLPIQDSRTYRAIGVQVTYLTDDFTDKISTAPNKRIYGICSWGIITLRVVVPSKHILLIAEGVETALSAPFFLEESLKNSVDIVAAVTASNLVKLDPFLLRMYKRVIIASDNDETGKKYSGLLLDKVKSLNIQAEIIYPPLEFNDFNDAL